MNNKGLTTIEVKERQKLYGKNELSKQKKESFIVKIFHIICEPMFLLLLLASVIYFILGEARDGIIMLVFVFFIIMIDIIQEWKTDKTLKALKELSEPYIKVIRDDREQEIKSSELVPGDVMFVYEGIKIPADGHIIECSSLKIDESSLTGEAVGIWKDTKEDKDNYYRKDYCYQGTLVIQGSGMVNITSIGDDTEYGKIGSNISNIKTRKTPLEEQIDNLVKWCTILALLLFIIVVLITFFTSSGPYQERIITSIISGVTLAMAMIPEEFPVVLTVFLSMGAWRLAQKHSLVKKLSSVETLGAISVLCVDKTGTITKNQMEVKEVVTNKYSNEELARIMCLSCTQNTYDPMEQAMIKYGESLNINITSNKLIKEYPFDNETKMMAYLWLNDDNNELCAKGSPESIINLCNINSDTKKKMDKEIRIMQNKGLRVIAVARGRTAELKDLDLIGLVGLIDPPKDNIADDIKKCYRAGIKIAMITGDNGITASAIARNIGMHNTGVITGDMIDEMSDSELAKKVRKASIFSRVRPEHKMRIIKAYQDNGEVVAMTGDGVNDAPALKQADIGIAMGKRGSEVSREAASLILLDDNFTTIIDTIRDGRRIYDNIKKAIGYIMVIHIPIALSSLVAPLLSINSTDLMLLPIHIVILEMIIDPTSSIVLERQPEETNIMSRSPRKTDENIVSKHILIKSIIQGLTIFVASFGTYYYLVGVDPVLARTIALTIIILSNIFLVHILASSYDYVFQTILKSDKIIFIVNMLIIIFILLALYTPLNEVFKLTPLTIPELGCSVALAFIATFWYELVKFIKHIKKVWKEE